MSRRDDAGERQVQRAFEIADSHMFELLQSECVRLDEEGVSLSVVDDRQDPVATIEEAPEAVQDAFEWMSRRGYAELVDGADGAVVVFKSRPDGL